jgi:hypothetical protein
MKYSLRPDTKVEIIFNKSKDYVHVTVEGRVDFSDFSNIFDIIVTSPDHKSSMGRIWTLSDSDLSDMDVYALQNLTKFVRQYPKGIKDSKVALVSSKKINIGLCKLFKTYSIEEDTIVEVFEKFEDAERWITS